MASRSPAGQFIRLWLDELADDELELSPTAHVVLGYLRYRLMGGTPREISLAEISSALPLGERAARTEVNRLLRRGLVQRRRSRRPGGAWVYSIPDPGAATQELHGGGPARERAQTCSSSTARSYRAAGSDPAFQQGGGASAAGALCYDAGSQTPGRASEQSEHPESRPAEQGASSPAVDDLCKGFGGQAPQPPPRGAIGVDQPSEGQGCLFADRHAVGDIIDLFADDGDAAVGQERAQIEKEIEALPAGACRQGHQILIEGYGAAAVSVWTPAAAEVGAETLTLALRERGIEGGVKHPSRMFALVLADIRAGIRPKQRTTTTKAKASAWVDDRWQAATSRAGKGAEDG